MGHVQVGLHFKVGNLHCTAYRNGYLCPRFGYLLDQTEEGRYRMPLLSLT